MGRTALYPDRVRLHRFTTKTVRKEVIQSTAPEAVTGWIPCLYRTPSGRTDREQGRDALPENATLIVHFLDSNNDLVRIKPDDLLELEYGSDGTYLTGGVRGGYIQNKLKYKIVGEVVATRAKRLLESFQLEIVQDKEF